MNKNQADKGRARMDQLAKKGDSFLRVLHLNTKIQRPNYDLERKKNAFGNPYHL